MLMNRSFFAKLQKVKLFLKPKKIVIVDKINNVEDEIMKKIGCSDYEELTFPNIIYINFLIYSFFLCFFKGYRLRIAYYVSFIKIADPKLVLTFTDNNIFFYTLKSLLKKKIYFISHQNGWRASLSDLFDKRIQKAVSSFNLSCDYIFSFSKLVSNLYSDIIKCEVIETGCYINNYYKKINSKNKSVKKIIFISTSDFNVESRYNIKNKFFFSYEKAIIKFLFKYCLNKNISLHIYPKFTYLRKEHKNELEFFKNNLPSEYFNKKWFMIKKTSPKFIYKNIKNYDLAVSTESTLGYELLARGFKCIILKARCDFLKKNFNINFSDSFEYGWPLKIKKRYGFFWSNIFDIKIFTKLLINVSKINYLEWNKILYKERNKLYFHDYNNKRFYNVLKKIIYEKN